MPNPTDDVLIVGQLKDDALRNAITDLVDFVDKETSSMASRFDTSLKTMQEAMKQFGISQKVSVSLMKDAMKQYGMMFSDVWDQVNGGGGPKTPRDRDTLGGLKDEIKNAEKLRDTLHLWSPEIQDANLRIAELRQELREATKSSGQRSVEIKRALAKEYSMQMSAASIMPDKEIKGAEAKLRRLLQIKNELRATPVFDDAKMQRLNNQITTTIQRVRELRNVARVPTDVQGVLGMPIKTLDEIAAKMQAIRNIRGGFELGSPELKRLNMEYERLSKLQTEYLGKNTMVEKSNNALARSFSYIRNRIVYAMTLGAATSFTKQVYEIRGQYELLERSLGVLVNSFQKGSEIFQELNEMAIKSPFTLIELGTAAKQLTAYNFATEEVVETTRRLADISAALGVPMERLTYNLGQIRAQTVLTARDARDFANAGLPIAKSLADYYTELEGRVVSTGDVFDRMSKKAVSYNDVMAVLYKMTDEGGKFFDFQSKQADTLRVQINNLTLAWNNMLNEIGKENQGLLTFPVQAMKELLQNWQTFNRILNDLIWTLGSAKVAQLLFNMALSKGNLEVINSIALLPQSTAANYQESLSKMNLTKVQARWLIAMDKGNVALRAAIVNMGILTTREAASAATANIFMGAWTRAWTTLGVVMQGLLKGINMVWGALKGLLLNPATWFFAASMAITDLIADFNAAGDAADELNDTIKRRTGENSEAIKKFTDDYSKSFAKLASGELGQDEQVKLWEAIAEEIKKSAQNASQYITKLEAIKDLSKRDKEGGDILSDVARIQDAVNAAQERGLVEVRETIGIGGMWQHGLVEQLKDFTEELNDATKDAADDFEGFKDKWAKINDVLNSPQNYEGGLDWAAQLSGDYKAFAEQMDVVTNSIKDSMEKMWPTGVEKSAENIREFVTSITNSIKDANPEIKGQMERVFDMMTDNFIAMQAQTFGNIRNNDEILIQGTYSAWETFFEKMKAIGGKEFGSLMDYVVSHGDYSNEKLQEIWKKASEAMQNEANESYLQIARLVTNLNSMKVVIPVMFQEQKQNLNELQKDFEKTFITAGLGALPYEEYQKKLLENQRTYGKMQQKEGESTLAWNKRLNDMYNEQYANIAQQDKIMKSVKDTSSVIYQQAEKTKKDYQEQMKATKAVAKHEGFALELSKKNKGGSGRTRKDEDIIAEAFKQELSLIKDMQSNYEKLRKSGVENTTAIDIAAQGYEATLEKVNKTLSKYGITKFNAKDFLGKDVNDLLAKLEKQRADLISTGTAKTSTIEAMDMKINNLRVEAKSYNMNKITKGLNSELDKLKEEYELAVSLDADPELGSMFADYMGINLDELPKDAEQAVRKAQKYIDRILAENNSNENIDINELMSKKAFDNWVETSGHDLEDELVKAVSSFRTYLIKLRTDETKSQMQEWDKLLEKYAEYETKINKIQNDAVKERVTFAQQFGRNEDEKSLALNLQTQILAATDPQEKQKLIQQLQELVKSIAGDDKAKLKIATSIENFEQQETAKVSFEEFQETPTWLVATGDLAGMTNKAIGGLINSLEKYKKTAKGLDDKQIKRINSALKTLYKEQRKNNPFGAIANMIDEAKERLATVQPELDSIKAKMENIKKEIGDKKPTQEQIKTLEELKDQWEKLSEVGKISAGEWVESLMSVYGAIKGAIELVDELARAIGGKKGSDIERVFGVLDKAGQGAQIGAAFGGYGAAIGAAAGAAVGFIKEFGDEFTGNSSINTNIKQSEVNVKRLQTAFKDLEYEIEKVGGTGELTLRKTAIASREWQLAEMKRQLALEESRDSKNRDEEKIEDLRGQIKDLELDLKRAADGIVNDFLGISSVGDAAENMMGAFISALRSGEDAMTSFNGSVDDMVANMLKKLLTTKILEPKMQEIWDNIQADIDRRTKSQTEELQALEELSNRGVFDYLEKRVDDQLFYFKKASWLAGTTDEYKDLWQKMYAEFEASTGKSALDNLGRFTDDFANWFLTSSSDYVGEYKKRLENELANAWTADDLRKYAEDMRNLSPELQSSIDYVNELIKELGLEEHSQQSLSALQQGIQGVTETTAGALEAITSGMSQQVYYQSTLLEQIRDAIIGADSDIQLGVQGQILLQLQNSYQTQQAIQSILEGWSSPNGMSVRVEMI